MMKRRTFLGGTLTAMSVASLGAQSVTAQAVIQTPAEPLVWPVVTKLQPGIRSFAGHTDTVPDIVGRIGTGADCRGSGPDAGRDAGPAARARHPCQHQHGVAVLRSPRHQLQKKACTHPNGSAPTFAP